MMKFTKFKDFVASKWKVIFLVSFVITLCINLMNSKDAHCSISNIRKRLLEMRMDIPKEINHDTDIEDTTRNTWNSLDFADAKGSSVTPAAFLLNTTKISVMIKDRNPIDLPGVESMDKYLQLPPPLPYNSTEHTFTISQRRDYNILIAANDTCAPEIARNSSTYDEDSFDFETDVFLLMTVKSVCHSFDRRHAVRSTWGNLTWIYNKLGIRARLVFLLGKCESDGDTEKLLSESQQYSDILQWGFIDSFRQLALKEVLLLQWFTAHCREVPFLYQGDDDVLVNVENILKYLFSLPAGAEKSLWAGSLLKNSPRITNPKSKYFVSKILYPGKFYPPYVSGGGFLLSGRVAVRLFMESMRTRMIPNDDAFLGIVAKSIGIEPINADGFESWGMDDPSPENLATIKTYHRALPKKMISMWNGMVNASESMPTTIS